MTGFLCLPSPPRKHYRQFRPNFTFLMRLAGLVRILPLCGAWKLPAVKPDMPCSERPGAWYDAFLLEHIAACYIAMHASDLQSTGLSPGLRHANSKLDTLESKCTSTYLGLHDICTVCHAAYTSLVLQGRMQILHRPEDLSGHICPPAR